MHFKIKIKGSGETGKYERQKSQKKSKRQINWRSKKISVTAERQRNENGRYWNHSWNKKEEKSKTGEL